MVQEKLQQLIVSLGLFQLQRVTVRIYYFIIFRKSMIKYLFTLFSFLQPPFMEIQSGAHKASPISAVSWECAPRYDMYAFSMSIQKVEDYP